MIVRGPVLVLVLLGLLPTALLPDRAGVVAAWWVAGVAVLVLFAVGVGDANMNRLSTLGRRKPMKVEVVKFEEMFVWLSRSLASVSSSVTPKTTRRMISRVSVFIRSRLRNVRSSGQCATSSRARSVTSER